MVQQAKNSHIIFWIVLQFSQLLNEVNSNKLRLLTNIFIQNTVQETIFLMSEQKVGGFEAKPHFSDKHFLPLISYSYLLFGFEKNHLEMWIRNFSDMGLCFFRSSLPYLNGLLILTDQQE